MIYISCDASTQDVLQIVEAWVDLWAERGSEAAFTAIAVGEHDTQTPEWLENAVANYRPLRLFPDTHLFKVTAPDVAITINHRPTQRVRWYKSNKTGLAGDVCFDLPLNGQWSDLQADFDIWEGNDPGEDYILTLDEIRCWDQFWLEEEQP